MAYIPIREIETEASSLLDDSLDYLESQIDDYSPAAANLDVVIMEAVSNMAEETAETQAEVPDSIFKYFGKTIAGIPVEEPIPALLSSTWVAADTDGHTVEAGWYASQDDTTFRVVEDVEIPVGQTSTAVGAVRMIAVEDGAEANGLSGELEQDEGIAWVDRVDIVGVSAGGEDGEEDDAYVERLAEELQISSPTPIKPSDFIVLAQREPGVGRATAIDLYNADTAQHDVERCVTVAITDDAGEPVEPPVKNRLKTTLQSMREVNFLVFVVDPTYHTITITYKVQALPGWNADAVAANVDAALYEHLNPFRWGNRDYAQYSEDRWLNSTHVRYFDMLWLVRDVNGVDHVIDLKINGGTTDVPLSGVAPLVRSGTHAGTVEVP